MKIPTPLAVYNRVKRLLTKSPDRFWKQISGVIHVGANIGQERYLYDEYDLDVIWIEPIPDVFRKLKENITKLPKQEAFQHLITDHDGHEYILHIASNNGASSSILNLKKHKEIWPNVNYESELTLRSVTLAKFISYNGININSYQALIMDTQGSELLVLKGAEEVLTRFKYIKTEVPDFESYEGCCKLNDIEEFLAGFGFIEYSRNRFAGSEAIGNYYDIVYKRV